jgi:hypothetical protein
LVRSSDADRVWYSDQPRRHLDERGAMSKKKKKDKKKKGKKKK